MLTVDIKNNIGTILFDGAYPRNDFETKQQKTDSETGLPMWSIAVVLRQPNSRRSENLTVNVPNAKDPNEQLNPFEPIAFDGLRIMTGESGGKTWVSFAADKFGRAAAPSATK